MQAATPHAPPGGKDVAQLDAALASVPETVRRLLG